MKSSLFLFTLGLLFFSSCGSQHQNRLSITGSSTVAPVIASIAQRYEEKHPNIKIDIQMGGSSRGIRDTLNKNADIGMASRALKQDEDLLISHTIAYDGIALVLHRENPIQQLSREQVVSIFTGQLSNWKDVGGLDQKIFVINKAEGRATLEVFQDYFKIKSENLKSDLIIGDNEYGIKALAMQPNAIGYVSVGSAEYHQQNKVPIKLLPIQNIQANLKNLSLGEFPLSRPLNLLTYGKIKPEASKFIQYCQSKEVTDLIQEHYFVPSSR